MSGTETHCSWKYCPCQLEYESARFIMGTREEEGERLRSRHVQDRSRDQGMMAWVAFSIEVRWLGLWRVTAAADSEPVKAHLMRCRVRVKRGELLSRALNDSQTQLGAVTTGMVPSYTPAVLIRHHHSAHCTITLQPRAARAPEAQSSLPA